MFYGPFALLIYIIIYLRYFAFSFKTIENESLLKIMMTFAQLTAIVCSLKQKFAAAAAPLECVKTYLIVHSSLC